MSTTVAASYNAAVIRDREHLEREEDDRLAGFGAASADSAGREYGEQPPSHRTHFQRDWHRITHCRAFRKLEFKTQVLVYGEGSDFSRNRLTHTLEVSQITTSICKALGLNEDLGQAVALAHDLGHTPFGHAGEEKLQDLVHAFNHNHHGLRIVRELEERYPDFPGLNLTLETLEGMEKHETDYDQVTRHTFFTGKMPTLEAQAASVADAIAYRSHDVEDGLYVGVLDEEQLDSAGLELWDRVKDRVGSWRDFGDTRAVWLSQLNRHFISFYIDDVLKASAQRLRENGIETLEDVREHPGVLIGFSPEMHAADRELGDFLYDAFYRNYRVVRMARKGKMIIERLYEAYMEQPDLLPTEWRDRFERASLGKLDDEPSRIVADYIAGMTDRFANREYQRLFEV